MTFSVPVYALFAAALLALFLAAFILTRLRTSDSITLGLLALAMVFWSGGYGLELGAISLEHKLLGTRIALVGYVFAPYLWFLFTLEYSRKADQRRVFNPYWLGLVPLLDLLVLWFGGAYPLGLFNPRLETWRDMSLVVYSYGPWWYWGHTVAGYAFTLAGMGILLYHLARKPGLPRAQSVALIAAIFLPTLGNALKFAYDLKIDPTAITFTLTIGIILWAVFSYRLVNISPIARDLVVDGLRDGLIVVDLQYRIVDVNAAASRMIGLNTQQILGKPLAEALQPWQPLLERFKNAVEISEVVEVGTGQAVRQVGLRSSVLYDNQKRPVGRLISFLEMDPDLPRPHSAFHLEEPVTQTPLDTRPGSPELTSAPPFWRALRSFFSPPDLEVTSRLHPSPRWAQTIERNFTIIVRVLAVLGTLAFLLALPSYPPTEIIFLVALGSVIVTLWVLGLARHISYGLRTLIFFFAVYALTVRELANYGYSPEGFALSLAFVTLATLLAGARGGQISFGIILATLIGLGVPIGAGWYHPPLIPADLVLPISLFNFVQSIVVFSVLAGGLAIAVYALMVSLDRAHQKESQAQNLLQQERDLLEQRVQERTIDLAEARDQALEASRFKSQLISKVSHELRTPLGGVLGYAELLQEGVYGELSAEQRGAASDIVTSAYYLSTMINELLDQAQIEARAVKIYLAPFEPAHLLESVKANMTILASNKGLRLVSELDPALPPHLIGDERRLQQVLFNLIGNAIKFTETGQINVSLAADAETHWKMCVTDTGVGIPPEAQADIFESFHQVDNAVTRNSRGTGLGLSITKQLVELMGGKIELESEVGRGTVFTVLLPLQVHQQESPI